MIKAFRAFSVTGRESSSMGSISIRWSVYAGLYTFLAGAGLLMPLWVIARTVGVSLGVPTGFIAILVPGSGAVIGAIVWWAVIEHRDTYTYLLGGIGGVVTALLTVLCWTLLVAIVWGPLAILAARVVILFVLVVVSPVAFVAWLLMTYARRHWGSEHLGQDEPVLQ